MSSQDVPFRKETINKEMDSILSNTSDSVDLPPKSKPIDSNWLARREYNTKGTI